MEAKILVIGSGAREHAICWKLSTSSHVSRIYIAPGNAGTNTTYNTENVAIDTNNFEEIVKFCRIYDVNLVVVGSEVPLSRGISNVLHKAGIQCFGPTAEASKIESNKQWSKHFMDKYHIQTARWKPFVDAQEALEFINTTTSFEPLVVKASGLAAGKGVIVARSRKEASKAVNDMMILRQFGEAADTVIVEEFLKGEEISVLAFSDGKSILMLPPIQDHKRLFENDVGPNTGGMGAYGPCAVSPEEEDYIRQNILQKAIDGLRAEGTPFIGILYAGLIKTDIGIKVLEFNCRFGDPEAQVALRLLDNDLYQIARDCCNGELRGTMLMWNKETYCVATVLASEGYPDAPDTGQAIIGIEEAEKQDSCVIFHAGTKLSGNNKLVTSGGRVLTVTVLNKRLPLACVEAVIACKKIHFNGCQFRQDIGHKGIPKYILQHGNATYKCSGVDITNANDCISKMKLSIEKTYQKNILSTIGSFGAVIDVTISQYKHPLLVTSTDGVGTKLQIAQQCNNHSGVGKDLVAMCVNDILAQGAEPLFFLDYFACGKLQPEVFTAVVESICAACKEAGCSLVGGETAEMPDFYEDRVYDLAGFVVGIVDKENVLPRKSEIKEGDIVIYLPSNGFHSNGFSLLRKVIKDAGFSYKSTAPFANDTTFEQELLRPTHIYAKDLLPLIRRRKIKAFAHITGGGLLENIPRILPNHLDVLLDANKWSIPPIFAWCAAAGNIGVNEMLSTFNCGIGGIIIVSAEDKTEVEASLNSNAIGRVYQRNGSSPNQRVKVINFMEKMEKLMIPYVKAVTDSLCQYAPTKRVAVLISGHGTNLKALIDATMKENLGAKIIVVISSKENVNGLLIAQENNIKTMVLKPSDYSDRDEYDKVLDDILLEHCVDIICLAGFMRILTTPFVKKWRGKMINIHPSLLPSFKGIRAQKQALDAGVRITGCTAHFVEPEIDSGAIIEQATVRVHPTDDEETLVERIKVEEHKIYPRALKLLATGKIKLDLGTGKILRHL